MIVDVIFAAIVLTAGWVVADTEEYVALKDQSCGGAIITSATMVPATGNTAAYCRVMATIGKATDPTTKLWRHDGRATRKEVNCCGGSKGK